VNKKEVGEERKVWKGLDQTVAIMAVKKDNYK
jgi:hypothetical protein